MAWRSIGGAELDKVFVSFDGDQIVAFGVEFFQ
jgi:hypothetical protein